VLIFCTHRGGGSSGCVKRVAQGASSNSYFPTDELQDRTNDCRDPIQPRGPLARFLRNRSEHQIRI